MDLRVPGLVVFADAGIDATPAAYAARKVKPVAEKCIGQGSACFDVERGFVFVAIIFFEALDNFRHFSLAHFSEMFLEESLPDSCIRRVDRYCQGRGARGRSLKEISARQWLTRISAAFVFTHNCIRYYS